MARLDQTIDRTSARGIEVNKVLKNTYMLLAMTLLFSAAAAGVSMMMGAPRMGIIVVLGGYFALLFLTNKFRNSSLGLLFIFMFTGFLGFTLGPILNFYLNHVANGPQTVMLALGGTGVIFVGLSLYALISRKNFGFIGGILFVGILVGFAAGLVAVLFNIPALSLAVSAIFVLLMSGLILYQTSEIIHGGETNYIMATVTLYMTIYNLFTSLLHLLGVFGGDD